MGPAALGTLSRRTVIIPAPGSPHPRTTKSRCHELGVRSGRTHAQVLL